MAVDLAHILDRYVAARQMLNGHEDSGEWSNLADALRAVATQALTDAARHTDDGKTDTHDHRPSQPDTRDGRPGQPDRAAPASGDTPATGTAARR